MFDLSEDRDVLTLKLKGRIDFETSGPLISSLTALISQKKPHKLIINLESITYFDDYGALVLEEVKGKLAESDGQYVLEDPNGVSGSILSYIDFKPPEKTIGKNSEPLSSIERIGEKALHRMDILHQMITFLGSVSLSFSKVIHRPGSLRFGDTLVAMQKTGVNALPIVCLISFLLGLVIAFMSSIQLRQFGANIYVASLVAIAMVSELGPIMTAIVVAGRSGSAFAAEIGTMKISDEIDALTTMGFEPVLFLALPRIVASIIVIPILTMFSILSAIAGGLVVGVSILNLSMSTYMSQTLDALTLFEINWGLMKSLVFAVIISLVGCLRGFQARGGSDAVGNAATSAVVTGIFLIILFDSFFAVLRSYWW